MTKQDQGSPGDQVVSGGSDDRIHPAGTAADASRQRCGGFPGELQCQRELLDSLFVLVAVLSADGLLLEANQASFELAGVEPDEVLGTPLSRMDPLREGSLQLTGLLDRAAGGEIARGELTFRRRDGAGRAVDAVFVPLRDGSGAVTRIVAVGVDITDRKNAEAGLLRVNRELLLLRACDQLLVKATAEKQLLNDVCRIIVEIGNYRLAWVGLIQPDAERSVLPVAQAGLEPDYLRTQHISRAQGGRGDDPAGRAIRDHRFWICRDLQNDPDFAFWRDDARRRGYRAAIALPLLIEGECLGVLNVHADDPDVFADSEIALLEDLTADVAYGIRALRTQIERAHAEAQAMRLARITRMQSGINAAVLRIRNGDELLKEACRIATEVGGYDRAVISMVEEDGRRARPRYRAGAAADFPEPAVLEIGDGTEPDTNLSSRALRTGEIAVCSDLSQSEPPVAMREQLLALGYKSLVSLPLIVEGSRVGVLTLTSRDVNLLRAEEVALLTDIMSSLAFGLRSQRDADAAQFLVYYDSLTGLAKRVLFCERLDELLRERSAPTQNPLVAAFDIRGLSQLNDAYGRRFGDLLLQEVAERLKRHSQTPELTCYLGAGTFALVEPHLAAQEGGLASLLSEAIFGEPLKIEGRTVRLSYRSGAARYPADGVDANTLLHNAEAALKQARESGEQYLHYQLDMRSGVAARLELEHKLRAAIDEQQFEVYYQPQLSAETGAVEAVEALLRWRDPDSGIVSPAGFLPVLESSGMIPTVGNWVLARVVADCERWRSMGIAPIRVAVNISALQLRRRSFLEHLLNLCGQLAPVGGFGLDLEITETAVLQEGESVRRTLRRLRKAGMRIALDDFGTGYSSLGLLSKLPVDLVKIDRSFVKGLPTDRLSFTLVQSIVGLASALGLMAVAEGVETQEQLRTLQSLSCHYWQGYLFSPALPAPELEQLLVSKRRGPTAG